MQKIKLKWLSLLVLLFIFVLAGCGSNVDGSASSEKESGSKNNSTGEQAKAEEGAPKKGGEAVLAYLSDASSYDPILGGSGVDQVFLWPIYETLIAFTPELELEPGLATSWEMPDDKTIILHLREDVTFHDGTTFDAEAVKFNLDRVNSEESRTLELINVDSVEVVDPLTVKLLLKQPDASVLGALTDRGGMMASPTAVEKEGDNFTLNPVGAGPYKMVKRVPNGEIIYEAFEDYWQEGKPYLDKMTIKVMAEENTRINALKSGEVDYAFGITAGNVPSLESDANIVLQEVMPLRYNHLFVNATMAPLDNKAVRLAILHGIDREAIVKAIDFGKGVPAEGPFPIDYWAADKEMKIDYDPEKSKQLLKEAGLENVSFTMIHRTDAYYQKLAEAIQAQLKEVGIKVDTKPMELQAADAGYFAEKNAHAYLTAYTGRLDPHSAVNILFAGDSFYNVGGYSTPKIESLIAEGASIYDREERVPIYQEISNIAILEEGIGVPISYTPAVTATNNKLKGYEPNLLGKPFFNTLWIEE